MKTTKSWLGIAIIGVTAFWGCQSSIAQKIQNVDSKQFQELMKTETNRELLDVRTTSEFENGHIPGAQNLNINGADFESRIAKLDTNKTIFVYCLAGGRSARAAEMLEAAGFKSIINLADGFAQWNSQDFPVEAGKGKPKNAGLSQDAFKSLVGNDTLVLVDFGAAWCTPCVKMKPQIAEIKAANAGSLVVHELDYDENNGLMKSLGIATVPVFRLYRGGEMIWEHQGAIDKSALEKEIDLHKNK